jgi:hypothetical protein
MTKLDRLVAVMKDGQWHSTEDLVDRVGHRFSAAKHVLRQQGYQFEVRRDGVRFEYRMVSVVGVSSNAMHRELTKKSAGKI